jgi:hypothetical protein
MKMKMTSPPDVASETKFKQILGLRREEFLKLEDLENKPRSSDEDRRQEAIKDATAVRNLKG